jgi:uncharacterized protein YecE (DUF72 family)
MDLFEESSDLNLATQVPNLLLGTQGFSYSSWVGPFYPKGTKAGEYLSEYAKRLNTVELDTTFYQTPKPTLVDRWKNITPDNFIFTAKFPKLITHEKNLKDCDQDVSYFLSVMSQLGNKLGPLVLQFEYTFKVDQLDNLAAFLEKLPKEYRYAVEIRHRSWLKGEEFYNLLTKHRVALVLADLYYMPKLNKVTTDFVYIRWLGNRKDVPDDQYEKIILDRTKDLLHWSEVVKGFLKKGLPVRGYFNNHFQGHSPGSIRIFLEMIRKAIQEGKTP